MAAGTIQLKCIKHIADTKKIQKQLHILLCNKA